MGEPPKKVYPPGWNDPPMLNYNCSNPPPKTRITNKRVAFPLNSTSNSPSQIGAPFPGFPGNSGLLPVASSSIGLSSPCIENLYLQSKENFNKIVEKKLPNNENIKEQIEKMFSAWHNGEFSECSQHILSELSTNILTLSVGDNNEKINELLLRLTIGSDNKVKGFLTVFKEIID